MFRRAPVAQWIRASVFGTECRMFESCRAYHNLIVKDDVERILEQDSVTVAETLIGWRLFVREADGSLTGGCIIETEAYSQEDAASHSYHGRTPRTEVMFGPSGHIYVYFTYGMHWCMNIVTGPEGHGQAVLVRAIRPESGLEHMRSRRGGRPDAQLANGPAKLCQALAINGHDNGAKINQDRFVLLPPDRPRPKFSVTHRIGITQDIHRLWRFVAN